MSWAETTSSQTDPQLTGMSQCCESTPEMVVTLSGTSEINVGLCKRDAGVFSKGHERGAGKVQRTKIG